MPKDSPLVKRLPGEPHKPYWACVSYCELGANRTIGDSHNGLRSVDEDVTPEMVRGWADRWDWSGRAAEFDRLRFERQYRKFLDLDRDGD
jgi:hypothetical protein